LLYSASRKYLLQSEGGIVKLNLGLTMPPLATADAEAKTMISIPDKRGLTTARGAVMPRPDNYELGKFLKKLLLLGRYVEDGKRSPEWAMQMIQNVIDRKEDGSPDFNESCEVVDLGTVPVNYDLSTAELVNGYKSVFLWQEQFETLPRAYEDGEPNIHLAALHYTFGPGAYAEHVTLNDIRKLNAASGYVPVQLPELTACLNHRMEILQGRKIRKLLTLGLGVGVPGTVGGIPMVFEHVPVARRFDHTEAFGIETDCTFGGWVDRDDWYLVRVR
jgi:hypothetical protein